MAHAPDIAFFGSSLLSAYWNGAATYYRGIIRALHMRGCAITFYEPDVYDRQRHRDIDDPEWAKVIVYAAGGHDGVRRALDAARRADIIIKTSGVGVFDEWLEAAVLDLKRSHNSVIFWDVDAPATLERLESNAADPFRPLIRRYDLILTYGGGDPVVRGYGDHGARACVPVYNALDPATHYPVMPDARFAGCLGFLGNRLPDREARVESFFFEAARQVPARRFVLGGNGWAERQLPPSVSYVGHVYTRDHNAFNCTPLAVLNINRDSMARFGFSPPTRVFEAAGASACLITDAWEGIELFLEPEREVLVARSGDEVVDQLARLTVSRARWIGEAARQRILGSHTYEHRAHQLAALLGLTSRPASARSGNTPALSAATREP
jgi:spore maturation protein CgeB